MKTQNVRSIINFSRLKNCNSVFFLLPSTLKHLHFLSFINDAPVRTVVARLGGIAWHEKQRSKGTGL